MEIITYKQVLDKEGQLEALELWQGGQKISVTLAQRGIVPTYSPVARRVAPPVAHPVK